MPATAGQGPTAVEGARPPPGGTGGRAPGAAGGALTRPGATVTVVIAAFNAAQTLGRAVRSVDRGTIPARVVVVDDGSSDGTGECLAALGREFPIDVITQDNAGLGAARAAGGRAVTTDWMALLDADDECAPGRLERQIAAARTADGPVIVSCGTAERDPSGTETWKCCFDAPGGVADITDAFLGARRLPTGPSILMATADYRAIGGFSPDYRRHCELDFFARAIAHGTRFLCVPGPLYIKHASAESSSGQSGGRAATYRRLFPDWTGLLQATADPARKAALTRFLRSRTLLLAMVLLRGSAETRRTLDRCARDCPWLRWHQRVILRVLMAVPGAASATMLRAFRKVRRALAHRRARARRAADPSG